MPIESFPTFRPHPLFRGGHAQTLAGAYLPAGRYAYTARRHHVALDDGDQLVLHDDLPAGWENGDRTALLIHGMGGSHESGYMQRIAHKLNARGLRVFRMDLRGCGAGWQLARRPYHSGRSPDAAAALRALATALPQSRVTLIGFSLGANIVLKLLGELGQERCGNLDSAMAVCPPIDLAACSRSISQASNRWYDRYFVGILWKQVRRRAAIDPVASTLARPPRTLWEFDNVYTAVACGFGSADDYYRLASSAPHIEHIRRPTLILAAADDPLIPCELLERVVRSSDVEVRLTAEGGHLGFVGRGGFDADRRWMDWRVVDWVAAQGVGGTKSTIGRKRDAVD